jgi:hypothetical protein
MTKKRKPLPRAYVHQETDSLNEEQAEAAMVAISMAISEAIEKTTPKGATLGEVMASMFAVGLELIESHAPGHGPAAYGAQMSKELDGWLKLIGYGEGLGDARHDC